MNSTKNSNSTVSFFRYLSVLTAMILLVGCAESTEDFSDIDDSITASDEQREPSTEPQVMQQRHFGERLAAKIEDSAQRAPNILVIAFDNVRADRMSSYGNTRQTTPNLDDLAARGVRFSRCISQAPYTPHSFASMLSSLYVSDLPVRVRAREPSDLRRAGLEPYHVTLAEALREFGYDTAAVVMGWFTDAFGLQQGFDWVSYKRRNLPEVVDVSLEWLRDRSSGNREKPFFLFSYSLDVHAEFMEGQPRERHIFGGDPNGFNYSREKLQKVTKKKLTPTEEDLGNALTLYDEGLYWADHGIKRLLDGVQELGLAQETIIVFVSDHGEEFGEKEFLSHGQSNFAGVIDVPLIFYDPRQGAGRVVDERVMNIDIMPTILDLAGVPTPASAKGLSLVPSMRGEPQPELKARPLFSEGATNGFIGAVIVAPHKLLVRRTSQQLFLYDIDADPRELRNYAKERPELARRMEQILFAHKRDGLATQLLLASRSPILLDEMALPRTFTTTDGSLRGDDEESVLTDEARKQLEALGYL